MDLHTGKQATTISSYLQRMQMVIGCQQDLLILIVVQDVSGGLQDVTSKGIVGGWFYQWDVSSAKSSEFGKPLRPLILIPTSGYKLDMSSSTAKIVSK